MTLVKSFENHRSLGEKSNRWRSMLGVVLAAGLHFGTDKICEDRFLQEDLRKEKDENAEIDRLSREITPEEDRLLKIIEERKLRSSKETAEIVREKVISLEKKSAIDKLKAEESPEASEIPESPEARRKHITSLVIYNPKQAKELVLKGVIDTDRDVDYGRFYNETEGLRGVSKENTELGIELLEKLDFVIDHEIKKKEKENIALNGASDLSAEQEREIIDEFARKYNFRQADLINYMGDLLRSNGIGSCHARAKLNHAITTKKSRWKHIEEVKFHHINRHIRPIIRMDDGSWYAIDGRIEEMSEEDFNNTVVAEGRSFVEKYLGLEPSWKLNRKKGDKITEFTKEEKAKNKKNQARGDYLTFPIPGGLNRLEDLGSTPETELEIISYEEWATINEAVKKKKEDEERNKGRIPEDELEKIRKTGVLKIWGYRGYIGPSWARELTSLEQLRGMNLSRIVIRSAKVRDLSPLEGMKLTSIVLVGEGIKDISPLKGMPLKIVEIGNTSVTDFSALEGAPIEELMLSGRKIDDISFVRNITGLRKLNIRSTNVRDISVLKGMSSLRFLKTEEAPIRDYTPIKGLTLYKLDLNHHTGDDLSSFKRQIDEGTTIRVGSFHCPVDKNYQVDCSEWEGLTSSK